MILPPMQVTEALTFIRDVIAHSRLPESTNIDPYFPFSEKTCQIIIEDIQKNDELKPRAIMQAFNAVLSEADPQIEAKEIQVVSPDLAKKVLAELVQLK